MFRKNFKIFKFSKNIKENVFFSTKIIKNVLKNPRKKKHELIIKPTSFNNKTINISNYFKAQLSEKKKRKALFFSKNHHKKKNLLYFLIKSKLFPSHLDAINYIKGNNILVKNKIVKTPFKLINDGDFIQLKELPYSKEIYYSTEFFSKKGKSKIITNVPIDHETSFGAKSIVISYLLFALSESGH